MYKVFVKDIPIILSTQKNIGEPYTTYPLEETRFKKLVRRIFSGEKLYVNIYHRNPEKLEHFLRRKIKAVEAAGGVVYNDMGDVLFIRRNKKWDLPKGKIEKGESIEEAAIREVEEETGIKDLVLNDFIMTTYHVFTRDNKFRLKITHWYRMHSNYKGAFSPQIDEGIKKVKWKNKEKVKEALQDSYGNIKLLFES
ncbi:MAG TPA: NUDIX domain-containing protein [Flavobacteriaceae bacterium]|nr:NUDIX domain-containing protein [Flavobacteriaceae bacterium]